MKEKTTLLSVYLWTWKKWKEADVAFRKYREFYSDGEIYCRLDTDGGEEENFQKVCDIWGAKLSVNPIRVGRCGWMGHYEGYDDDKIEIQRECWPMENAFTWMDGIYDACKDTTSKYMIIMEDDTYINKPITILNEEFGIAVAEYNTNFLPDTLLKFVEVHGGDTDIPLNIFGKKGYGGCGGFIINTEQFVEGWDKFKPILERDWELIRMNTHLIGWVDVISQLNFMVSGFKVVMNKQLIQTWYGERPDLFPTFTHWKDYEIIDFLKDKETILSL